MRYVFLLLIAFQQCQGQTPNNSVDSNQVSRVFQYIQDYLTEYSFILDSVVDSSSKFLQLYKEQSLGCVSDFNGDKIDDYALLLRDANNKVYLFSFSIINNSVKHYLIDCLGIWEDDFRELKVVTEPKGKWEAIEETIIVPNDGISVDDLRKSLSYSYYWEKTHFVKFLYD
ncbi:MAG: hypothetical protein JXA77_12370 [Bacteroidales bacterium]|nr:hypothetical protein [Bacteroidales bacterium]MBN2818586.1 hypothetical protein [Bacteroidales bacterium]